MLQQDDPDDYVIATNKTHSVRHFAQLALEYAGLDWKDYVVVDERLYRPAEVHYLQGDYSKAKRILKWEPKVTFTGLVEKMIQSDLSNGEMSDRRKRM